MLTITNAVKAQIIAAVNALLGILSTFGIGHITDIQKTAVVVAVNAVLALLVAVTYKQSSKRLPDAPVAAVAVAPAPAAAAAAAPVVAAAPEVPAAPEAAPVPMTAAGTPQSVAP